MASSRRFHREKPAAAISGATKYANAETRDKGITRTSRVRIIQHLARDRQKCARARAPARNNSRDPLRLSPIPNYTIECAAKRSRVWKSEQSESRAAATERPGKSSKVSRSSETSFRAGNFELLRTGSFSRRCFAVIVKVEKEQLLVITDRSGHFLLNSISPFLIKIKQPKSL